MCIFTCISNQQLKYTHCVNYGVHFLLKSMGRVCGYITCIFWVQKTLAFWPKIHMKILCKHSLNCGTGSQWLIFNCTPYFSGCRSFESGTQLGITGPNICLVLAMVSPGPYRWPYGCYCCSYTTLAL